jgi:hypothetical protein
MLSGCILGYPRWMYGYLDRISMGLLWISMDKMLDKSINILYGYIYQDIKEYSWI